MSSIEIVLTIISVAGTLSSIMFAYLAFKRGNKTENKAEGKNEGVLISDIGYIKSSIDRIEKSIDKLQEENFSLKERIVKVESELDNHVRNKAIHTGGIKK